MGSLIPTFRSKEYASHSVNAIPQSLRKSIEERAKDINHLAEKLYEKPYSATLLEDILGKVKKKVKELSSLDDSLLKAFSRKECRCICLFAHQIAKNDDDYKKIISILDANWKDSFIRSLVRYTISNWNFLEKEMTMGIINPVYEFFLRKLERYDGDNERIFWWKKKIGYLKLRGYKESRGGVSLFLKECNDLTTLLDAPTLLKLRKADFHLDYFQKVIYMYCKSKDDLLFDFDKVMDAHKNSDTGKIVLSNYICDTETNQNLKLKQIVLEHYALNMIGHPSQLDRWKLKGYDNSFSDKLEKARKIVNQWLINRYIDEMFRSFMGDEGRRNFWMKYANYISEIKIAGSGSVKREIECSTTLKESLDYCFIRTSLKGSSKCAFLMKMKDVIFVEFSDKGKSSLYIYRRISPIVSLFNRIDDMFNKKELVGSIDHLFKRSKDPNFPTISRFSIKEYGKIRHYNGTNEKWDETLNVWIRRNVGINV
jgi:hypothetical protein